MTVDGAMAMTHTADTPTRVMGMRTQTAATTVDTRAANSRTAGMATGTTAANSGQTEDSAAKVVIADSAGECAK